jgi:hypothetical protein
VFATVRRHDPELTAAFHKPELLALAEDFVKDNARFALCNTFPNIGKEALLIGQ